MRQSGLLRNTAIYRTHAAFRSVRGTSSHEPLVLAHTSVTSPYVADVHANNVCRLRIRNKSPQVRDLLFWVQSIRSSIHST